MQYVFVETGNEFFFSHIANNFCKKIIRSIIDLYKNGVFTYPDGMIDQEKMDEYIKLHGTKLCFLNCGLFPTVKCCNERCMTDHIAVLTSEQIKIIEESFANTVMVQYRNINQFSSRDRLSLQRIFHAHGTASLQQIEEIQTGHNMDHNKFLCSYLKKTDKLMGKLEGFVYVRAQTQSDYDFFISNTTLRNTVPCDSLQYFELLQN
jgi:hypothetical protein